MSSSGTGSAAGFGAGSPGFARGNGFGAGFFGRPAFTEALISSSESVIAPGVPSSNIWRLCIH